MKKITKSLIKELQDNLKKEKALLTEELKSIAKKDPKLQGNWDTKFVQFGTHTSEQDENVDEVEEYTNTLPVEHSLELRLKEVEQALNRIKKDNYGRDYPCSN